uniref:Uncharacterized protein n=1 Tax=Myoviridae sp. ctwwN25 TaxID=2825209 RepID=A0A8S5PN61_9CAUD|nr:MAG TPA: hypothetical protein [Myoviridae sp. ctwwN25]
MRLVNIALFIIPDPPPAVPKSLLHPACPPPNILTDIALFFKFFGTTQFCEIVIISVLNSPLDPPLEPALRVINDSPINYHSPF